MFSLFRRSSSSPESQVKRTPDRPAGYEASLLVDVVFAKTEALRPEDVPSYTGAERTMFAVLLAERLTKSKPLRVLDFGGACGFHHMAADLIGVPLRWAVVETPAMAEKAKTFSSASLQFFTSIADATRWTGSIDLMFSSSALQYLDEPDVCLSELVALRAPLMVWSRLPMSNGAARQELQTSRLSENGPGPLPAGFEDCEVSYSKTYLSADAFLTAHMGYRLILKSGDLGSAGYVFLREDLSL